MAFTCKTCGALAETPGHLCSPCEDESECKFCGTPHVDARHVCKGRLEKMRYVCTGCGRIAMEEWHLCQPSPIN